MRAEVEARLPAEFDQPLQAFDQVFLADLQSGQLRLLPGAGLAARVCRLVDLLLGSRDFEPDLREAEGELLPHPHDGRPQRVPDRLEGVVREGVGAQRRTERQRCPVHQDGALPHGVGAVPGQGHPQRCRRRGERVPVVVFQRLDRRAQRFSIGGVFLGQAFAVRGLHAEPCDGQR